MPLQATGGFSINSAFWLRSLAENELGPTGRVIEDLEALFARLQLPFQLRDVRTASDLYQALASPADPRAKPVLQLDMHGSDVLLSGRPRTRENLSKIRKQIKEGIKPDQQMLDRYANTFLLGRPCPFSIDQLVSAVEAAQR